VEADQLLSGLNDAQRAAVTSTAAPLCIMAGAGSGKTRVLTRRIAYRVATGDADPQRVLALTFTRKAAGELTGRLRQLQMRDRVAAGTFHSVALAQLRSRWSDRDVKPPELLERKVGFVARLLPQRSGLAPTAALDVVGEIEWAKARRIEPDRYPAVASAARRRPGVDLQLVADTFTRYEEEKRRKRMIDFDDLLKLCVRDLENDRDFAAAQRWRFRHLFVDEFQDVNPLQHALLSGWLGDRTDLCVVGDANQAIYGWNGADPAFITNFTSHYPTAEVVQLVDNYRSSTQILDAAHAVLVEGELLGELPARSALKLRANRPEGKVPELDGYPDEHQEARGIARGVRDRRRPNQPWHDFAVLVRTNAQTAAIDQAFTDAGIPARIRGGSGLLDDPQVKAWLRNLRTRRGDFATVIADLTAAAREHDGKRSLAQERERSAAEDPTFDPVLDLASESGLEVGQEEKQSVPSSPPIAGAQVGDSADGGNPLASLAVLAGDFVAVDPNPTGAGFAAWLSATARNDQLADGADAVDVLTFHGAKGLEWPVVFVAGCETGYCPIGFANNTAQLAEERRLFYVAITRAEREVVCTWATERTFGTSKPRKREPSPYLDDLQRADADSQKERANGPDRRAAARMGVRGARAAAKSMPKSGTSRSRAVTGVSARSELDSMGQELFDALKAWRAESCRAAGIPAYIVCNDRTLLAVARQRPTSEHELLDVAGFGPVKVERYGEAVLDLVRSHTG